ncbi:putative nuclease HARBI1 [Aphis craccivora]|uniref:Putative nuclease HARBI1 n=1 Tax=Aphis craccivora TaxID=307492 RepID=A0A6G0X6W2_APHCR|nr:putative nuclease HARBI1 [Aphis craccivora]
MHGDSGYPVLKYLMTPLLNPNSQSEKLYNESHIRTRNTVERCFGVIKRRFPILAYGIRMKKIDTIMAIITSTFILHNIAIQFNVEIPDIDGNDPLSLLINNGDLNINAINNQQQQDDVGGINQRANIINHYFSRL